MKKISLFLMCSFLLLVLSGCASEQERAKKELEKHKIPFTDAAMVKCIKDGDVKSLKLFLKAGKDVNTCYEEAGQKLSLLVYAIVNDRKEIVELLTIKGADVNAKDEFSGWTPLHWAALLGQSETAELLISKGADINARNHDSQTPLRIAVAFGKKDIVELFHKHKALDW